MYKKPISARNPERPVYVSWFVYVHMSHRITFVESTKVILWDTCTYTNQLTCLLWHDNTKYMYIVHARTQIGGAGRRSQKSKENQLQQLQSSFPLLD